MNGKGDIIELLASTELFKTLPVDDLATCAASFRRARFAKGELLFARGDPGKNLYLVLEGQVRLAIATSEGREFSFEIAGAGDLFGEIAVLDGWPRSAEATAITQSTTYTLERNDFHRLRSTRPAISDAVISFLCRRLRDLSDKLETVALYPMEVRLARFLLTTLGDREGARTTCTARAPLLPERACSPSRRQPPQNQCGISGARERRGYRTHLGPFVL
jgi:CRP/FNR family cyclic AMP-dependent transcriptional regulator